VCSVIDSAGQVSPPRFWRACAEASLETFKRLGEALDAQVGAGLEAIEVGAGIITAPNPAEFCARLADFWGKSLDCVQPMTALPVQGVTFAAALGRHLAGGMQTVPESVYQRRLAVCRACEFFRDNRCQQCGCRLAGDVIAKARWASEGCPAGRWPEPD
jgi:hypothetical protein